MDVERVAGPKEPLVRKRLALAREEPQGTSLGIVDEHLPGHPAFELAIRSDAHVAAMGFEDLRLRVELEHSADGCVGFDSRKQLDSVAGIVEILRNRRSGSFRATGEAASCQRRGNAHYWLDRSQQTEFHDANRLPTTRARSPQDKT